MSGTETSGFSNAGRNAIAQPSNEPNVPEAQGTYPMKSPVAISLVRKDRRGRSSFSSLGWFDAFIEGSQELPVIEQIGDASSDGGERDEQHHAEEDLALHKRIDPGAKVSIDRRDASSHVEDENIVDDDEFTEGLGLRPP